MSYYEKLEQLMGIIKQHNRSVADGRSHLKLDSVRISANIQAGGATDEESLALLTAEDLQELGLPKIRALRVFSSIATSLSLSSQLNA